MNSQMAASWEASSTLLATIRTGVSSATQQQGDPLVLGGDADGGVDDEQHDLGLLHGLLGLLGDLVVEGVAVGHPAAGVEQGEVVAPATRRRPPCGRG